MTISMTSAKWRYPSGQAENKTRIPRTHCTTDKGEIMAKGDRFQSEFSFFEDPYTSARVKRLTDPQILSHHMYFYNRMTTKDPMT